MLDGVLDDFDDSLIRDNDFAGDGVDRSSLGDDVEEGLGGTGRHVAKVLVWVLVSLGK